MPRNNFENKKSNINKPQNVEKHNSDQEKKKKKDFPQRKRF